MLLLWVLNHLGEFDKIFCGKQAIDGDTAQVGAQELQKI
jgi:electron transfer flavoprotein alpha/beta subunit